MSGRAATDNVIAGQYALSVGDADMPAPAGWTWTLLTDVARLESGHTPSRNHPEWWGGEVPWIGIRDAREHHGETIHVTRENTNADGLANSAARLLPAGTVCLSRTASVGYVVVMGREMATSQDFVNWVCSDAIEPEFLKHLLIAENESLHRFSKGTTHSTIYFPEVKAFRVCLPPVAEQRRIVAKLDALKTRADATKEALDAVPPLLETFRRSVLAAAFRGDLTRAWREKHPDVEPATELLARIRAERRRRWEETNPRKKFEEPKTTVLANLVGLPWVAASLVQLVEPERGITYGIVQTGEPFPEGIQTIRCGDIKDFRIAPQLKRVDPRLHEQYGRTALRGGEIVIAIRGTVGATAVVPAALAGANISREVALLPVLEGLSPAYLMFFLASPQGQGAITKHVKGVAQSGINIADLRQLTIPVPSGAEQNAIVAAIESSLKKVDRLNSSLDTSVRRLSTLQQAILAKAFRGELVAQDPNDEPASVLLERIAQARAETPPAKPKRRPRA